MQSPAQNSTRQASSFNPDRIGISTNILDDPGNLQESLLKLSEHFKTIEIEFDNEARRYLTMPEASLADECERLMQLKKDRGLNFSVHAPYIGRDTDISNLDDAKRERAVSLMLTSMEVTARLGAERFTCHPGYLTKDPSNNDELYSQLKKSLIPMVKSARAMNIAICLENTGNDRPNYIVLSDKQHNELCGQFGIALTMDIIHFTSFRGIDADYYKRLKPILTCVANVHVADMEVPKHVHLPLGIGTFQFDEAIHYMAEAGYSGNFIVEERGAHYTEQNYIDAAARYRKRLMTSVSEATPA
ncbi:MAG: sugar phosphate isomerase/epimerase [Ramlibacter sp.]|nr:sugar phosphate isomerase/epimerase [Ramlibacter sp.]